MECVTERRAKWRELKAQWRKRHPEHRQKQAEYYHQWYQRNGRKRAPDYADVIIIWQKDNPEKVRARGLLAYAVKCGIINTPNHLLAIKRFIQKLDKGN